MKKVIYFGLFVATLFITAACSSDSPGAAAKKYAEYLKEGKYEKFVEGIAIDKDLPKEELKQQKEMLVSMLKEKGDKKIADKGGIKSIQIISEEIIEDAEIPTAKVVLEETYGNGETDDMKYDMVKQDGTWKIVLKK